LITLATIAALSTACATAPAAEFDREAAQLGFSATSVAGASHPLRVYASNRGSAADTVPAGAAPRSNRPLHIYLDGDGRPFVRRDRVARDPTPQDPLTLRLLAADPGPALYLGRPCYHGLESRCDAQLWTNARYGEVVLASMAAAITAIAAARAPAGVVLIGYSGGGTLAVLLAARLPAVNAVVTVAANLDVAAWTRLHGYSPLTDSLDPARMTEGRVVPQWHLTGSLDRNVPPALNAGLAARLPCAEFKVIEGFDHHCCWAETWPARLAEITEHADVAAANAVPADAVARAAVTAGRCSLPPAP
jgi:pimeloyl-ACP methyl ester carboxylesterase